MLCSFGLISELWFDSQVVGFTAVIDHGPVHARLLTALPFKNPPASPAFLHLSSLSLPSLILRKKLLFASFDLAFFYPVFWRWIPKCMREEPVWWRLTELWNAVWREASSLFKKESRLLLFNIFSHFLNCLFSFLTLVAIKARFNKKGEKLQHFHTIIIIILLRLLHVFSVSLVDSQVQRVHWGVKCQKRGFSPFTEGFSRSRMMLVYHVTDREKNQKKISMECLLFTFSIFETWTEMLN